MDLSEVQKTMIPGAKEVLKTGIGLDAGKEAFALTAISVALDESDNNQSLAARKLGVTQSFISMAVNGKALTRFRGKKPSTKQKTDNQADEGVQRSANEFTDWAKRGGGAWDGKKKTPEQK